MAEAIAIVGTIVSTCALINDIRKAFRPVSVKKEMQKLFILVEDTKDVMDHLAKRLRKQRHRDHNRGLFVVSCSSHQKCTVLYTVYFILYHRVS